jgi:predicted DNA-binding transcriptional regulator AlpA
MNEDFELCLNHISAYESQRTFHLTEEYKQIVRLFLNNTGKVYTESKILKRFPNSTMEQLQEQNPEQYEKTGFTKDEKGNKVNGWIDFYDNCYIIFGDPLYERFFAYKIRSVDLMTMDDFLDYHLEKTFKKDLVKYVRFLNLTLRKHETKILDEKHCNTVEEWIKAKKKLLKKRNSIGKSEMTRETADDLLTYFKTEVEKLLAEKKSEKIIKKGLISSKDVLEILNISPSKLFRLETKGEIKYTKIGGRRRYREEEIQKYIDRKFN